MATDNQLVHNWLLDIPTFQQDSCQTLGTRQRPLSISSEDSINLDELINANYTTCMDDETDLTNLASIDLDDSNEDFWKLDNVYHHFIPPTTKQKSRSYEQDHILNTISLSNLSLYDTEYPKRYDRSGSLSSENSSSTTTSNPPTLIPRSHTSLSLKKPSTSKSETTTHLSRRATHIPTPKTFSSTGPMPQKTKSTASVLQKKSSTSSLTRSSSRMTSHIPAPPVRSTTSLGLSSPPVRSTTSLSCYTKKPVRSLRRYQ